MKSQESKIRRRKPIRATIKTDYDMRRVRNCDVFCVYIDLETSGQSTNGIENMMSRAGASFAVFNKQLDADLHALVAEARRRNSEVKEASHKSIEILKTIKTINDLENHPDFVVPFALACKTKNAKMTTIAMQCLQNMASTRCIPEKRMDMILDAFIEATQLAMDIQLKVLQLVPIFFKTYSSYLKGGLCKKLLYCCTSLLRVPNKAPIVAGTASATLQQLMDEIFDRLSDKTLESNNDEDEDFEVLVNNNDFIKVNAFRYDANLVFSNLCSIVDTKSTEKTDNSLLDITDISTDLALEILESILQNGKQFLIEYEDLQFVLRIKTIPLLLRCMSNSKQFSTVLRCFRCIRLLIDKEFLMIIELELEVMLSMIIHNLSLDSSILPWQRVLSLEIFNEISQNPTMLNDLYDIYDKYEDKKPILHNFLTQSYHILLSDDFKDYIGYSSVIEKIEMPLISNNSFQTKNQYMQMLDKNTAPNVNITYIIWLIVNCTNCWSEKLSSQAVALTEIENKSLRNTTKDQLHVTLNGLFENLFNIHTLLLQSSTIDTTIFHNIVRAFQKLTHCAGMLGEVSKVDRCLDYFRKAIITVEHASNTEKDLKVNAPSHIRKSSGSAMLSTLSESIVGPDLNKDIQKENDNIQLYPQSINSKQVSLFRALTSLAISLGPNFSAKSWYFLFTAWNWVYYFIYGPSNDILNSLNIDEEFISHDLSRNDLASIENTIHSFHDATKSYPLQTLIIMLTELEKLSDLTLNLNPKDQVGYQPFFNNSEFSVAIYNPSFFISEIAELTSSNMSRILASTKTSSYWDKFIDYMVSQMADRKRTFALRLYCSHVIASVYKTCTNEIYEIEDTNLRKTCFTKYEQIFTSSLNRIMASIEVLEVNKLNILNENLNTEGDIIFQVLNTLKEQLNEFGDMISDSWVTVFSIINSPFRWIDSNISTLLQDDSDDLSLIDGIIMKQKNMIQVSFDVFKLITDDFLKNLHLNVIPDVIDTIVAFVNQEKILNVSFSSISQFWLVGDYLRSNYSADIEKFRTECDDYFTHPSENNAEFIRAIKSPESTISQKYYGIWLYLLKNLLFCSLDKRNEVSVGAIQTFFRIIDSHSSTFPSWQAIFNNVLYPFLNTERSDEQLQTNLDCLNVTLKGLVQLFSQKFSDFDEYNKNAAEWSALLQLFIKLLQCPSTGVRYVTIKNYGTIVTELCTKENIPTNLLDLCATIWTDYNIGYSDFGNSSQLSEKTDYDCISELLLSFPSLCTMIDSVKDDNNVFYEKSMSLLLSAVKFPLLPEHSRDQAKPSTLQNAVLEGMSLIYTKLNKNNIFVYFVHLSMISTLLFDTRDKIEKKLAPKLHENAISRIPTFEALSYKSLQMLEKQLSELKSAEQPRNKYVLKILRNLREIIVSKSLIDLSTDGSRPLWVLASSCYRSFLACIDNVSDCFANDSEGQQEFIEIFMSIFLTPLRRRDTKVDSMTEKSDLSEFDQYSQLFKNKSLMPLFTSDHYDLLVRNIWDASLIYEFDDIQKAILQDSGGPKNCEKILSHLNDLEVFGLTRTQDTLSKVSCSKRCLQELISFALLDDKDMSELKYLTFPYIVSRISLLLGKYISDEFLSGSAPIPKLRGEEMNILLNGLLKLLDNLLRSKVPISKEVESLAHLYPLVLRTIPVSHKLTGLQNTVLELSLSFTKLISASSHQP